PPSDSAARLSASEVAAFKAHLDTCWAKPSIASDSKPHVAVRIALAPDGRLRGSPEILAVSSASSVDGPALVQSVMHALTQCQPYNSLPAAKYKEWKVLDLNFSQDAISDVSSSRNNVTAGPKGGGGGGEGGGEDSVVGAWSALLPRSGRKTSNLHPLFFALNRLHSSDRPSFGSLVASAL